MKFNTGQREGLAKVADNIATACMVGLIIGGIVENKIGWGSAVTLSVLFFVLLFISSILRREQEDSDGN